MWCVVSPWPISLLSTILQSSDYRKPCGRQDYCEPAYRMVGNFREVFIFAFFASQEPFAKIKTAKILLPKCKTNEPRFNPWPTSIQQPTKACQQVCLSLQSLKLSKMLRKHGRTIQTAAQGRERKQSPRVPDSPIVKIKTAKISEIGILAYFAKICTHENYQPYGI